MPWGLSLGGLLIAVVILAACIAVVVVALRAMGVSPPGWVIQIGWILLIAFVAVVAIKILLSM